MSGLEGIREITGCEWAMPVEWTVPTVRCIEVGGRHGRRVLRVVEGGGAYI